MDEVANSAASTDRFDPTAYTDEVKARIEAAIQKKVEGEEITLAEPTPAGDGKVIDLMEALRASLGANKTKKAGPAKTPASKKGTPVDVEVLASKPRRPARRAASTPEVKEAPPAKVRARK